MTIINIPVPVVNETEMNFFGDSETGLVNLTQALTFINDIYHSPFRRKKKKLFQGDIFKKKSFAEEAISIHCDETGESILHYANLLKYDSRGYVTNLSDLGISTVKTKSGKYGGTYIHRELLLSILASIDGYLKRQAIKVIVENDILGLREDNKSAYKRLIGSILRSPSFEKNANILRNTGKLIKTHLEYKNINNIPFEVLEERKEIVKELEILIRNQCLNSLEDVKRVVRQMDLKNISNTINLSAEDYTIVLQE